MRATTISVQVRPYRLLTKVEAAHYCRRPVRKFESQCPVLPIKMGDGDLLWDVQDLDSWIDSLKQSHGEEAENIVGRLG